MNRQRLFLVLAVGALLAIFAALTINACVRQSATFDETSHLVAGYSYGRWHDFRLNPEHPPLLKRWAALPLLFQSVWPATPEINAPPSPQGDTKTLNLAQTSWAAVFLENENQWTFAYFLLHGLRDEALHRYTVNSPMQVPTTVTLTEQDFLNNSDKLLFWSRLPITFLGVLLGLLIFLWTKQLFGTAGAILALALFCFDPNFIAHSGLVTTDVGLALFLFGAMYFFWRTCRQRSFWNVTFTTVFVGAAAASKFSAVLLIPMMAGAAVVWIMKTDAGSTRPRRALVATAVLLICAVGAYVLLLASYNFRFDAARDPAEAARVEKLLLQQSGRPLPTDRELGHLALESTLRRAAAYKTLIKQYPQGIPENRILDEMAKPLPTSARLMLWCHRHRVLPEAYLFGLAFVDMKSVFRSGFLFGKPSIQGWWYYFPVTFLLKTPVPTLLAIIATAVWLVRRRRCSRLDIAFLLIPVGIYVAVSLGSHLNIGHRHLLPIYPFLFVMCGSLGVLWEKLSPKKQRIVAGVALVWVVLSSQVVFAPPWRPAVVAPHYLAYFNELAGGPRNGYKCLVDSNLDWGQDLKHLRRWLDQRQITDPVNLCYFGTADPRREQICHLNMPGGYFFEPVMPLTVARTPGYVIISATHLQGAYMPPELIAAWREFLKNATLVDTVGYSLFIYYRN